MQARFLGVTALVIVCALAGFLVGLGTGVARFFNRFWAPQLSLAQTVTAMQVSDTQELVVAEYFGEVVASLSEILRMEDLDLKRTYNVLRDSSSSEKSQHEARESLEFALIRGQLESNDVTAVDYIAEHDWQTFYTNHYEDVKKRVTGNKKQLVYLARGRVSALVDLSRVCVSCVQPDGEEVGLDDCVGAESPNFLRVEIDSLALSIESAINPWYVWSSVEKQRVPGFEVLDEHDIGKGHPEYVRQVRRKAESKLETEAIENEIKEEARASTVLTLGRMFALLVRHSNVVVVWSNGPKDA